MSSECLDNMEFDKKNSIFANIFYFLLAGLIFFFIISGMNIVADMPEGYEKVMSLIFTMWATIKMVYWLGHPKLIFRDKKKPYHRLSMNGY